VGSNKRLVVATLLSNTMEQVPLDRAIEKWLYHNWVFWSIYYLLIHTQIGVNINGIRLWF